MNNTEKKSLLHNMTKSKFVRSFFFQIVSIFMVVVIAIIAITFFSFTSEINNNIIAERQKQLEQIESTISDRINEVTSISYHIGEDKMFYIEPVDDNQYSGIEMGKVLRRYLVGNDFIEHLAYYRISEPDVIYTANGELSLSDFMQVYLGGDEENAKRSIEGIRSTIKPKFMLIENENESKSFLSYCCPLPKMSKNPQAFVLILIPYLEIKPVLASQLATNDGVVAIYDANGDEICHIGGINGDTSVKLYEKQAGERFNVGSDSFVTQKTVSADNGWTYVSAVRLNDMISETASRQLVFIVLLLVLMVVAIAAMLTCVVKLYKPINKLAMSFAGRSDKPDAVIDEQTLLSDTFATLKDDSDQKQRFETAYNEANAANKAKSAFLSNMSHDIRTPMNAIVGMTDIALKNLDDPRYVRACLEKVQISSQYLLDIINNVLDMNRIESGKFTLSEDIIELPKLIHGIITILNQSLNVKSQRLVVEVENVVCENVIGDNVRLTQVFMNILSNSCKFTPNGGSIGVKITQTAVTDDGYCDFVFVFSDNGIGMSPEFTKKVFDTFTRDKSSSIAKIEGTGLGMSIAKSFVELMGGSIRCESELGKGTVFTVKMHMKQAENKPCRADLSSYGKMSVLVVGNERAIYENQLTLFGEICGTVDYAENRKSALKAIGDGKKYDFVIINQSYDDMSGVDTVTEISAAADKNTTFVLAAQDILSVEKSNAFDSGISAFVQTPLFRSTVLDILGRNIKVKEELPSGIRELSGMNVLLVEDNDINMLVAETQIKTTKANVYEATNGGEAVEMFKKHEVGFFDVILMDVQMPVMNGFEATAAIRSIQREDAQTVRIYAMTANTFDEDVRQVREAGMNGHLGKPYNFDELYRILEKAYDFKNN